MESCKGCTVRYWLCRFSATFLFFFHLAIVSGQQVDHYEAKFSLGSSSVGWYKLATFDLNGYGSYNSIVVEATINYIKTSELGYTAKAHLYIREGSTSNGKWNYEISGTQIGDYLAYKKVNTTTYELYGYSNGNYGHMSVRLAVTKEAPLLISIATNATLVADPNVYADVPKVGNMSHFIDKVGIGTISPDSKLTVKGNIHVEEVKVDLSVPGPDYVFKEDYDLKSLAEVKNYIEENGHLPNIPSAKEMEKNGIHLGEMNMKLLEKIEELTLYILEQQNEINQVKKELFQLKQTLKK